MSLVALTSLSPAPGAAERQRFCLETWRRAGLLPLSLNCEAEAEALRGCGVPLELVKRTEVAHYGRHVVPVNEFVGWVERRGEPALVLNADIELRATPEQTRRFAALASSGMAMVARVNHDDDGGNAAVEPAGFDGFLISPRHRRLYAESFLSLGQPWWDYWVPWMVRAAGEPLYLPTKPFAYHRRHHGGWGWDFWSAGAVEFGRLAGLDPGADQAGHSRLSTLAYGGVSSHATKVDV